MADLMESLIGQIPDGQRFPLSGTIELTYRCNLRCVHCFCNLPRSVSAQRQELPLEVLERVLKEISAQGCLMVNLSGGEPLLRKDFDDIVTAARRAGLLVTVATNGTLMSPEVFSRFRRLGVARLEISLYGLCAATHDAVTGVKGSFQRTITCLKYVLEKGMPVLVRCPAMRCNYSEIPELKRMVESLGALFLTSPLIVRRIDGATTRRSGSPTYVRWRSP